MNTSTQNHTDELLTQLRIKAQNSGASWGNSHWSSETQLGAIRSIDPSSEKLIAEVYNASRDDYEKIVAQAQQAAQTWRQTPAPKRGDIVRQIGQRLRQYKSQLGSLVALEMGKSKQEGDGEVQEMIDMADFCVGQSRMLYGHTMHSERPQHRMYEQWHPLGVVGVISAFNFPVAVWSWNAFIAAICGNTVIWKPSHKTPLCAIAVQHLCNDVMQENNLPAVFSTFITDDNSLAENMVCDTRLPLISFTGSSSVGRHVNQLVAGRMGRCLLECSGNNAIIVDASADLAIAVPAIVFGAMGTAGQRCTSTRRLLVHQKIEKELSAALVKAYQSLKIGNPLDPSCHLGPVIDELSVKQYQQAVQAAQEQGGTILAGGKACAETGYFVEPTLIRIDHNAPIVQQETFAPILYVSSYNTLDEAIAIQNQVSQGLSSAIFTRDLQQAEIFLSAQGSDCGIANVNIGTSGAEIGGAFGGEKDTGGGREAGSNSWQAYMRRQTNTINWSNDLPLAQGIEFNLC